MVDGTADCACNQWAASARQMFTVEDGLGKVHEEVGAPLWEDVVEQLIVVVPNVLEELLPALPHTIAFGVCTLNHCISVFSCCSSAVSQEVIAGGRGRIREFSGSWLLTAEKRREAR